MKAKDYAARLIGKDKSEHLRIVAEILVDMLAEVSVIAKVRRLKTDEALVSVMKEQDQKYRAFCRLCANENVYLKENGFAAFLLESLEQTAIDRLDRQIFVAKLRNSGIKF